MSKFTVGKTYLTRGRADATITLKYGDLLLGTVKTRDVYGNRLEPHTSHSIWSLDGACMFSGSSELDLMVPPELDKPTGINDLRQANEQLETFNRNLIAENKWLIIGMKELYEKNTNIALELEDKKSAITDLLLKLSNARSKDVVLVRGEDDLEGPPMCEFHVYPQTASAHACPFKKVFINKYSKDEKTCFCCEECVAKCAHLASKGLVDAAKCK